MRYAPDHKAKTRKRIVRAAARTFRRHGYRASGVDAVMAAAGLTAGGFYSHFRSKDDLFAEVLDHATREAGEVLTADLDPADPDAWRRGVIQKYLSVEHLRRPADGCPLPPLLGEIARAGGRTRRTFSAGFEERVAAMAAALPAASSRTSDHAIALWATMVGAMLIARALADHDEAERVLRACREFLLASLDGDRAPERATRSSRNGRAKVGRT